MSFYEQALQRFLRESGAAADSDARRALAEQAFLAGLARRRRRASSGRPYPDGRRKMIPQTSLGDHFYCFLFQIYGFVVSMRMVCAVSSHSTRTPSMKHRSRSLK